MYVLYTSHMPAKPVQISIDTALLERVDKDPETRREGRSAFVRKAIEGYLAVKERREVEARIAAAYGDQSEALLREAAALMPSQVWPDE